MIITEQTPGIEDIEIRHYHLKKNDNGGVKLEYGDDYECASGVVSFNTETLEAEMIARYLVFDPNRKNKSQIKRSDIKVAIWGTKNVFDKEDSNDPNRVVTFKCRLRGFAAFRKSTGEKII